MAKLFVALLCVCAVALAIKPVEPELKDFVNYMTKFNKKYASVDEFQVRYQNYQASLQRIAQKNKNSKGAVYGVNKFSDMTPEEFKKTMLMKDPIVVNKTQPHPADRVIKPKPGVVAPSSLDWRAKGAVTPVKDQGQCGSCWAFSVTENIESMWILAGKATNETLNLSPQQIVDCDGSDGGCDGGNPPTAYAYVINAGGLEPVADYPYTAEDGSCAFNKADVSASISNWKYATEFYSETELQNNLVSWGPLSVCVDAEAWQDYQSGVLTWEECAWVNILDHCVQLVGYDETGATPYWIVRNSWGQDWGLDGYILLEKGSDTCGIAHEATCSVV